MEKKTTDPTIMTQDCQPSRDSAIDQSNNNKAIGCSWRKPVADTSHELTLAFVFSISQSQRSIKTFRRLCDWPTEYKQELVHAEWPKDYLLY